MRVREKEKEREREREKEKGERKGGGNLYCYPEVLNGKSNHR